MSERYTQFFELLKVALGNQECLSKTPNEEEWCWLYEMAEKQAISGICFVGVKYLVSQNQKPSEDQYWEWLEAAAQIQKENERMDKKTSAIWKQLKEDGLESAILKGQGIATLYKRYAKDGSNEYFERLDWKSEDLGNLRQSGDIDIWVKGGYQKVCDYVQRTHPTTDVAYHRFHYDFYYDTEVEIHHRPTLMRNLFDDRKLTKWYNSFSPESFVYLEDKGFAVPPIEFNVIFILTHIYRHFLFEGIGLRQLVDYYFVLRSDIRCKKGDVREKLKEFRLMRFAEAIMWILYTQLGLEKEYLLCKVNEKEGRFVLNEILQTGNFGYADSRYKYQNLFKLRKMMAHGTHLLMHYPSEVLWTPIWLLYHKMWKWNKIRKIKSSWK